MIHRRAIDSSRHLGSFYDIYQDVVLEAPTVIGDREKLQLHGSIRCELIAGDTVKSQNLLKMIGIDDDLRLSILLEPALRIGIAALIDYPYPIDKYTRFLYFFYADREQRLPNDPTEAKKWVKSLVRPRDATHIITAVNFGIDVVIVLRLSCTDNTDTKIDRALENVRVLLENSIDISNISTNDKDFLGNIIEIKADPNVEELTDMTSLHEIFQYINGYKKKSDTYRPLEYTLQSIEWLYRDTHESCAPYISLEQNDSDNLEQHLIKLSKTIKRLKYWFNYDVTPLHFQYLRGQVDKATRQWQSLQEAYKEEVKRFKQLIMSVRSKPADVSEIDQALSHDKSMLLNNAISKLTQRVRDLRKKGQMIGNLQKEHFDYCNVAERYPNQDDNEQTLKQKLIIDDQYDRIFCSSDLLKEENLSKWETLCCQLTDEQRKNPSLRLLCADFSYCSFDLQDMAILISNKTINNEKLTEQKTSSQPTILQSSASSSLLPSNEIINILLLGESGVGKSTFINAFVNYIKFETFEQAQSSTPVVIIPVSFLITTGDNFDEHIVKFGDSDSLNNENFDHPGQSVTQHCKSYVFRLDYNGKNKLRIIDTPGFGDTRGLDQDELNMHHILEYINNLTHLNAVCFLLKPNTSKINNFFQTCLTQLLDLLGSNARQNIIFCFTNARSTFYTPGDTAPLLKDILKSLSMNDIPFKKDNTFCFDSESFRYLVALQNEILFTDKEEKDEYKMSWTTSVNESRRLLKYIRTQLNMYLLQGECQSIKHAQLEINHMIRPILETMRNILRNKILRKKNASTEWIELRPKAIHRSATICLSCPRQFIQAGSFWVVKDSPHEIQDMCHNCECASSQHIPIDYLLNFISSNSSSDYDLEEMNVKLDGLCDGSAEFAHFLIHVARSTTEDPFLLGINRMIREEESICENTQSNHQNSQLVKGLKNIQLEYSKKKSTINRNQQHSKLQIIYELIQTIREYPMVQVQMGAVRETQQEIMKLHEYKAPEGLTGTSARSTTTS